MPVFTDNFLHKSVVGHGYIKRSFDHIPCWPAGTADYVECPRFYRLWLNHDSKAFFWTEPTKPRTDTGEGEPAEPRTDTGEGLQAHRHLSDMKLHIVFCLYALLMLSGNQYFSNGRINVWFDSYHFLTNHLNTFL